MRHLTREEVARWRESTAPGDRDRIVGHLAVCDECAALFEQADDGTPVPAGLDAARHDDLKARGYAAYRAVSPSKVTDIRPRFAPRWTIAAGLAAAAALVLAVYPLVFRSDRPLVVPEESAVRGASIQLVSPVGSAAAPIVFEWTSAVEADWFEVEVVDDRGGEVWRARVQATRVEPPTGLLAPGRSYTWRVTAQGQGERRLESAPQTFVAAPGP